jgi:hypothetical protein
MGRAAQGPAPTTSICRCEWLIAPPQAGLRSIRAPKFSTTFEQIRTLDASKARCHLSLS